MFVTAEDFNVPPFQLNNLDKMINTFNDYVEQKEEEVLRLVLGDYLFDGLVSGLAVVPDPEAEPPVVVEQRWIDLRDGVGYTNGVYNWRWVGLKKLLVPYIHAMWIRDTYVYPTGLGMVKSDAENGTVVNPSRTIIHGYNTFARLVGNRYSTRDTLYGYLNYSDELYLDVLNDMDLNGYLRNHFGWPGRLNILNI